MSFPYQGWASFPHLHPFTSPPEFVSNYNQYLMAQQEAAAELQDKAMVNVDLVIAAREGDATNISKALDSGADPNVPDPMTGLIPLTHAAITGDREAVRLLLDAEADPNRHNIPILVDAHPQRPPGSAGGPLLRAARFGHTEVVRLLLERNASPTTTTSMTDTVLVAASRHGHAEIVDLLLRVGCDPNEATSDNGRTALMCAARHDHIDAAQLLLDANANVDTSTTDVGLTALVCAAGAGHLDMTRRLIDHNADVNLASIDSGRTPLMVACSEAGSLDVALLLLQNGAGTEATTPEGHTALMTSIQEGQLNAADLLLNYNANPNCADNVGYTALMFAALEGYTKMAQHLVVYGADISARAMDSYTPISIAHRSHHVEVAQFLMAVRQWSRFKVAIGCRMATTARRLLCSGEVLPGSSVSELKMVARAGADQLWYGSPAPDAATTELALVAPLPWGPSRHSLFHSEFQRSVEIVLCAANAINMRFGSLPRLAPELWIVIISFIHRNAWSAQQRMT